MTTASGLAEAEVISWSDDAVVAVLPDDATSGSLLLARAPGDTLGPVPLFVRARAPFDPAALSWREGPQAPRALSATGLAALHYPQGAALSTLTVLMAGRAASGLATDSAYLGTATAEGGVASWAAAPQDSAVPRPRRAAALTGADRTRARTNAPDAFEAVAYLVGGLDSADAPISEVLGMGVSRTGTYSLWTPLAPLPLRRAGAAAAVAAGNLIVAGGFGPDSVATADVFFATVDSIGTLNGWFAGPSLPEGRAFGALVALDETLYYVGGETGTVRPDTTDAAGGTLRGTIWAVSLSQRTGFFSDSVWTEVGQLALPRSRHAAFALDGGILVTAGVYAGAPSASESEFVPVAPDGTVGPVLLVSAPTIADLGGGALSDMAYATVFDSRGVPHAVLVGGRTPEGSTVARTWWF